MAKFITNSWNKISPEIVSKSFSVCGQLRNGTPEDISCLKEGNVAHEALEEVKSFWYNSDIGSVEIVEEVDQDQDIIMEEEEDN